MKEVNGPLTSDIQRYLEIHRNFNQIVSLPFNDGMGGITAKTYFNSYLQYNERPESRRIH